MPFVESSIVGISLASDSCDGKGDVSLGVVVVFGNVKLTKLRDITSEQIPTLPREFCFLSPRG